MTVTVPRRLRLPAISLVLLGVVLAASSSAAEIDSVTTRRIQLGDSTESINAIINQRLLEGVANANVDDRDIERTDSDDFCDEDRLYSELRKAVFESFIPRWGLRGYDLDLQLRDLLSETSYSLSLQNSIYRDLDYLEGFSLKVKELSDVIRIDGHLIGLDKFGHFFAEGWEYFEQIRNQGETIEDVMRWGSRRESGAFGYATTGIYSFADLVANFNGWRFWNAILDHHDAPLKGKTASLLVEPYVHCDIRIIASLKHRKVVKEWQLSRHFDILDYVDGAWDEGHNCNSYADPTIEEKVDLRTEEIAPGFSCPAEPKECYNAQQKYGNLAKYLLHPRCLTVVKE